MFLRTATAIAFGAQTVFAFVTWIPPLPRTAHEFVLRYERYTSSARPWGCRTGSRMEVEADLDGDKGHTRRDIIAGLGLGAAAMVASSAAAPEEAVALGPIKMTLTDPEYASVTCPPKTQVPGEKAGAGLKPVCVKVTVTADNPNKKDITDAAVFGFVFDEENTSVVANNPDGASDAGQFAIIPKVPAGSSRVSFQFVAAIEPKEDFDSKKLKFTSLKAISYPGGQQYGAITECEMNPLAAECDFD